jgi:hypothetical protein
VVVTNFCASADGYSPLVDHGAANLAFTLKEPPCDIVEKWEALKKANFQSVDAAMPVPGRTNEAWFFMGDQFAHVRWAQGQFLLSGCLRY